LNTELYDYDVHKQTQACEKPWVPSPSVQKHKNKTDSTHKFLNLNFHLKKVEKGEKTVPNATIKKKIINIGE
jgi:hypothetical protein